MQQTERLWYGEGINSLTIKPMWKFPFFDPTFFLVNASWIRDALLPVMGLAVACVLAVRHRWRFPLRFSIICLIVNAALMSLLLPLRTNRYSYHLVEILLLVCAAVAIASGEGLLKLTQSIPCQHRIAGTWGPSQPLLSRCKPSWQAVGKSSAELTDYVTSAYDVRQLRIQTGKGSRSIYRRTHG